MSVGINSRNIDDLHPAIARGCREWIRRMAKSGFVDVGISATYRDKAQQDWLFAQGRSRPGNIVTNARGGQSIHNYRLAFDFFRNVPGQAFADSSPKERAFWDTGGRIWEELGGVWGGSWRGFIDRPHCEFTGGLTLTQLQAGRQLQDNFKMPWEEKEMRYRTISDMPGWARPYIQRLIDGQVISGKGIDRETGEKLLDMSEDMTRTLIIMCRLIKKGSDAIS